MIEFFILIAIVLVCCLLFGKADTKREVLNLAGLDLSEQNYENKKEAEFEKICRKVLKSAYKFADFRSYEEKDVINAVDDVLSYALGYSDGYYENFWLGTGHTHYIKFAYEILGRRESNLKSGKAKMFHGSLSNKSDYNRYIDFIWEENQYPWPSDWKQKDSAL